MPSSNYFRGRSISSCFIAIWLLVASVFLIGLAPHVQAQQAENSDKQSEWNGYEQFRFKIGNRSAYVVMPKEMAPGRPWVWRARFPNYHAEMDIELLAKGYHIAYLDVAGLFGSPQAVQAGNEFYDHMISEFKLATKPVLEGVSRGGLFVYNWAKENPDKVTCIYCDTPVCDIKSWPAGKGSGLGSASTWQQCLTAYGMTEAQAESFQGNPIDHAEIIAAANIPILHIVSETDRVVPPAENTYRLRDRLMKLGYPLEVISVAKGTEKSNGHHFTHPDPQRVVDFIVKHSQQVPARIQLVRDAKRIVFLGDSITYSGQYVTTFDAWLQTQNLESYPTVINVGLPSETVSGLSENGHAGGRFPRPDLDERLDRVLAETQPDLVFACYGINCGIYQPLDEKRFLAYQKGIANLYAKVTAAGAKLILITPPTFDDDQSKNDFSYNQVMGEYAKWLVAEGNRLNTPVIDLHTSMSNELARRKKDSPQFTFQPDSVHPNEMGHWYIASQIIDGLGDSKAASAESPTQMLEYSQLPKEILQKVSQRMATRRDAYLTQSRHVRPGIREGLPLEQANVRSNQLTEEIDKMRDR